LDWIASKNVNAKMEVDVTSRAENVLVPVRHFSK
jgi:hypothetical protein